MDFAGPSYFGGKNNELVLCAGKGNSGFHFLLSCFNAFLLILAGDIHVWDQESGALLHYIRPQAHGGDLTCIAWNHSAIDPFMFAAGSHDGAVRVWTRPPDEPYETDPTIPTIMSMFPRSASPYQLESNMSSSSVSLEDFQSGRSRASPSLPEHRSASFDLHPSGDREYP